MFLCVLVSESHNPSSRNSARRTSSSRHRQNRKEIPGKDSNKFVWLSIMYLWLNGEWDGLDWWMHVLALVRGGSHPSIHSTHSFSMGCAWWQAWWLPSLVSLLDMQCFVLCFGLHDDFFLVSVSVLVWLWCVLGFWVMGLLFFNWEWMMLSFFFFLVFTVLVVWI